MLGESAIVITNPQSSLYPAWYLTTHLPAPTQVHSTGEGGMGSVSREHIDHHSHTRATRFTIRLERYYRRVARKPGCDSTGHHISATTPTIGFVSLNLGSKLIAGTCIISPIIYMSVKFKEVQ